MKHEGYVYIMASNSLRLYIGVTNNLERRVWEHKRGKGSRFASKYSMTNLLYYEIFTSIVTAIDREKELKGWKRCRKLRLVQSINPKFLDLASKW